MNMDYDAYDKRDEDEDEKIKKVVSELGRDFEKSIIGDYLTVRIMKDGVKLETNANSISKTMLVSVAVLWLRRELEKLMGDDVNFDFYRLLKDSVSAAEDMFKAKMELDLSGLRNLGKN